MIITTGNLIAGTGKSIHIAIADIGIDGYHVFLAPIDKENAFRHVLPIGYHTIFWPANKFSYLIHQIPLQRLPSSL